MYKWLWSKFYDDFMKDAEDKVLRDWRRELLQNVSGDVLELGCGTGANLEFYSGLVEEPPKQPLPPLKNRSQIELWRAQHPDGWLVVRNYAISPMQLQLVKVNSAKL